MKNDNIKKKMVSSRTFELNMVSEQCVVLIEAQCAAYQMTSAFSDCQTGNGKDYKGEVDKTVSGKDCQDWAVQKPHKHKFEDVGEHNFCRNPDNHTTVWCYTTSKNKRWEACDVPKC